MVGFRQSSFYSHVSVVKYLFEMKLDAGGYDSSYEGDEEENKRKKRKKDWVVKDKMKSEGIIIC